MFGQFQKKVAAVEVPSSANRSHEYLDRWLGFLVSACQVLPNAPDDGRDTSYLRDCHDYLDDARYAAKALGELRQKLHSAASGAPAGPTAAAKPTGG
ncbi:MAG: hypothetical protein EPO26_15185 [Chloroflexota bacterium]|nr:MAG: hypothetical protein EPO26_15185 [Chloroflexota bacterium]